MAALALHETACYEVLRDGSEVFVRALRPGDDALILRGFAQLSAESRYRRFFAPKPALTREELDHLTHPDGIRTYAIGALTWAEDGTPRPLGLASYVRMKQPSDTAAAAVTVIDAMQRKGLATILFERLGHAAYDRGIRHFRCHMLEDNLAVHKLIRRIDPGARLIYREPGCDEYELTLRPATDFSEAGVLHTVPPPAPGSRLKRDSFY